MGDVYFGGMGCTRLLQGCAGARITAVTEDQVQKLTACCFLVGQNASFYANCNEAYTAGLRDI